MCKITSAQIAADGKAVASAGTAIANAVAATDPALASELTTVSNALSAATTNWQTGTPTTDINTAATALEAVLNAIPETAPYASFVGIAVAALDVLIANIATQPATGGAQ
jgi:hypothetical protein